ncbi:MAG: hypothetical protein ACXWCX_06000 [Burkholderiales bacterium]
MKAGSKNLLRHAALGALLWATFIVFVAHAAEPRYTDLRLSDVKDGSPKQIFAPTTAKISLTTKLVDVPMGQTQGRLDCRKDPSSASQLSDR